MKMIIELKRKRKCQRKAKSKTKTKMILKTKKNTVPRTTRYWYINNRYRNTAVIPCYRPTLPLEVLFS